MKLRSLIVLRLFFVIFLASVLLLLVGCLIPYFCNIIKRVENHVNMSSYNVLAQLQSEIEETTKLFNLTSSSTTNLARFLDSSLNGSKLTFSEIMNKVAPFLFQALLMTPHVRQISYIGLEGLFFSYYTDGNQTFALYSNFSIFDTTNYLSSGTSSSTPNNVWYKQTVDHDSGKLCENNAVKFNPSVNVNASWLLEVLNKSRINNGSYGCLGKRWDNGQDLLFLNIASVNQGKGLIFLGFLAKELSEKYIADVELQGGTLFLATRDGKMLVEGLQNTRMVLASTDYYNSSVSFELMKPIDGDDQVGMVTSISVSCYPNYYNGASLTTKAYSLLNIQGTNYLFYCSLLDIIGVQSVFVLAVPQSGLINFVHKHGKVALILLISIIIIMLVSIFNFVYINFRYGIREIRLCAALIKQMEATRQAETKSFNKSRAFARASHDIRAPLAAITGLIENSYNQVVRDSQLETNLRQIDACTKDLLGILNSILDTSKAEAGKIELEEEEFDMAQFLEEVVDFYYPVGANKDIDTILDHCDGSVMKFSQVIGDRAKLKQILCNLLSNALKCTNKGHIVVRAWVRKPSLKNSVIASNHSTGNLMPHYLSCLFNYKNKAHGRDPEDVSMIKINDPNIMDFVFEVDDTGIGISKEKQKSIFEDYIQDTKLTALASKEGTGLGLGIVQSFVRLMHGEIGIVDKDIGEKGSCFRFNVLLSVCENVYENNIEENQIELETANLISCKKQQAQEFHHSSPKQTTFSPSHSLTSICSTPNRSPWLPGLTLSPKVDDGSYVVLLIENNERRRVSQKFMERLGIKVLVLEQWEQLPHTLKKIKYYMHGNNNVVSGYKSDLSTENDDLSAPHSPSSISTSVVDGSNYILSLFRRTNNNNLQGSSGFVLMVIDATIGPFLELCEIVNKFRNGLQNTRCRVVWLAKPVSHSIDFKSSLERKMFDPNDIIEYKPFHGTRLYQVVRLLPEFDQGYVQVPSSSRYDDHHDHDQHTKVKVESDEIQEVGSSSNIVEKMPLMSIKRLMPIKSPFHGDDHQIQDAEHGESSSTRSDQKPLSGKKILVVDDSLFVRGLAKQQVLKLGGTVDLCTNGKEALDIVSNEVATRSKQGDLMSLPYDYILMDCEMLIMNGYEATRAIRKMEESYGIHIPIFGLTAHTLASVEANRAIKAGMDVCLSKPLKEDNLLEAIRCIHNIDK